MRRNPVLPDTHRMNSKAVVTFGPLEGDREEKSIDVLLNGTLVGRINKSYRDWCQPATRARVWQFHEVELVLFDRDDEYTWSAPKWSAVSATKAAREKAKELLVGAFTGRK